MKIKIQELKVELKGLADKIRNLKRETKKYIMPTSCVILAFHDNRSPKYFVYSEAKVVNISAIIANMIQ